MTTRVKKLARMLKSLGSEHRLQLYLDIAERQRADFEHDACPIASIMSRFKLSAPTLSHHLKELANAGLILTERRGKFVVARVDRAAARELRTLLANVAGD